MSGKATRRETLRIMGAATAAALVRPASALPAQTPQPRIRIGQIGTTHGHAAKLAVYRQSPDYEVIGIVEPDPQLRARAETQAAFRDVPWMTREQLLNAPGLQAVLVETEVRDLLDNAEACVQEGKHVHLDKPAGASLTQFRRILEEAERRRLLVQMGYMYRYNPGVLLLHELLRDGHLGDVFEVQAVMSKVLDPTGRKQPAEFPGGMMFELGCHLIDLVVGVLGAPLTVTPYLQHVSPSPDGLMDSTLAILTYPRATASIRTSAMEIDGGRRRHLTVCGTAGTLHIQPLDNPSATLTLQRAAGDFKSGTQSVTLPKYERYLADAADMARILRREKGSDFSTAFDLAVQDTVLRACAMEAEQ